MHFILTLGLLQNRTNTEHYMVNIKCQTQPADLMAYMFCMMSKQEKDTNAQVMLNVATFERVAFQNAPQHTWRKVADTKQLLNLGIWLDGKPAANDSILVSIFLMSILKDDNGRLQAYGKQDGSISATFLLPEHVMQIICNKPKSILYSTMWQETRMSGKVITSAVM